MANQDNKGIVYVLTNSAMPGLVKIGMTTRGDIVNVKMKEHHSCCFSALQNRTVKPITLT